MQEVSRIPILKGDLYTQKSIALENDPLLVLLSPLYTCGILEEDNRVEILMSEICWENDQG